MQAMRFSSGLMVVLAAAVWKACYRRTGLSFGSTVSQKEKRKWTRGVEDREEESHLSDCARGRIMLTVLSKSRYIRSSQEQLQLEQPDQYYLGRTTRWYWFQLKG